MKEPKVYNLSLLDEEGRGISVILSQEQYDRLGLDNTDVVRLKERFEKVRELGPYRIEQKSKFETTDGKQ